MVRLIENVSSFGSIWFVQVLKPLQKWLTIKKLGEFSLVREEDPIFQRLAGGNLTHLLLTQTNVTDDHNKTTQLQPKYNINNDNLISIEDQLKPALLTTLKILRLLKHQPSQLNV